MTTDALSADRTPEPRFSQSVHVLMDKPMREAVVGLAVLAAAELGPTVRPKEGDTLRGLIESQLEEVRSKAPTLYAKAVRAGRQELAKRAAAAAARSK